MLIACADTNFTRSTAAPDAGVFSGILMSAFAMRFSSVKRSSAIWLAAILRTRANDHVPRIDARLVPTNAMIDAHSFWNWLAKHFIGQPMGIFPRSVARPARPYRESSITIDAARYPNPTICRVRYFDLVPESGKIRHELLGHAYIIQET